MAFAEPLLGLTIQLGAGGLLGFLAGYALKKLAKIVAVLLGVFVLCLMALNYRGIVEVRWTELVGLGEEALRWLESRYTSAMGFVVENVPFVGSFVAGFALGLKVG